MSTNLPLSRRRFLQLGLTASGALVLGINPSAQAGTTTQIELIGDDLVKLTSYVMIERDNRVVIGAPGCEIGQGVLTSLPMLVAEELDVDWNRVRVIQLPYGEVADFKPANDTSPGNFNGIEDGWKLLREAGATARWLLLQAAANAWATALTNLHTEPGHVVHADGRKLSYGALARMAAALDLPKDPIALKDPKDFQLIGKPTRSADARDIVTGQTRFGIDEYLNEVVIAVMLRCPHPGGSLESLDDSEARTIKGVVDVIRIEGPQPGEASETALGPGVAVLASNTWAALQGRRALKAAWKPGPWQEESSASLSAKANAALDSAKDGIVLRKDGDLAASRKRARLSLNARYEMPFLAHATMEPPNALVELRNDGALLIASVQDPDAAARMITALTGLARESIDIRLPRGGGSFGRRLHNDFVAEAVLIAKLAGKPVKLMWSREDDLTHDFYRPFGVHELSATLDRRNRVAGWSHHCAATPLTWRSPIEAIASTADGCVDADAFPAGLIDNLDRIFYPMESGLPRGAWRGRQFTFSAFAEQCFIDEIAVQTRRDAVDLRLEMLGESREIPYRGTGGPTFDTGRMAHVLKQCAEAIRWKEKRDNGHGLGIACQFALGAYLAHAFEVSMEGEKLRIHRAVCVADVGRAVNPLGLEAQLIGGTIDGISSALRLQVTVRDGQVRQKDFSNYPLLGMADSPDRVEVRIVESDRDPVDAYEVAIPSVAPALANAIHAATTVRIRKMPLLPELMRML